VPFQLLDDNVSADCLPEYLVEDVDRLSSFNTASTIKVPQAKQTPRRITSAPMIVPRMIHNLALGLDLVVVTFVGAATD